MESLQNPAFATLLDLLVTANKDINLTGITDPEEIKVKHFLDSLTLLPYLPASPARLIDVGTGAGFPGLVIAIMRPDIEVTLVESVAKKVDYLEHAITTLQLKNARAINGRAEDLAKLPEFREQFDVATARAVAQLDTLSEYTLPFLKINGVFLAQKKSGDEEISKAKNAIDMLGGIIESTHPVTEAQLPERQIIIIKKVKPTPTEYPRRAGVPLKKPL